MKRCINLIGVCLAVVSAVWLVSLLTGRCQLKDELICLYAEESSEVQNIWKGIRSAVIGSVCTELENLSDTKAVNVYLQESIPKIRQVANELLKKTDTDADSVVTLFKESIRNRYYDRIFRPAEMYETLRILIGEPDCS